MTGYLLDTHVLLWFLDSPEKLSPITLNTINSSPRVLVSTISLWEIAIKVALNKLQFPDLTRIEEILKQCQFEVLQITLSHVLRTTQLPHHHRDPFDRMLVAQSLEEDLCLISRDPSLKPYGLTLLPA